MLSERHFEDDPFIDEVVDFICDDCVYERIVGLLSDAHDSYRFMEPGRCSW